LQFIICANGIPYYEKFVEEISQKNSTKMFYSHYNPDLAYKLYAGADMLLMPSFYEPCGTSQLVAMRYGTVPIVREIGGLVDTVKSFDENTNQGNGFTFKKYDSFILLETIRKAQDIYKKKEIWSKLIWNCMSKDSSWNQSVGHYLNLYQRLVG
jgi:starch synthase